jgi:hypothetical protein
LLCSRLGPHLGHDDAHVLVPHLDRRGDELRVDNVLAEENERIARAGDVVGVLLRVSAFSIQRPALGAVRPHNVLADSLYAHDSFSCLGHPLHRPDHPPRPRPRYRWYPRPLTPPWPSSSAPGHAPYPSRQHPPP